VVGAEGEADVERFDEDELKQFGREGFEEGEARGGNCFAACFGGVVGGCGGAGGRSGWRCGICACASALSWVGGGGHALLCVKLDV